MIREGNKVVFIIASAGDICSHKSGSMLATAMAINTKEKDRKNGK